MIKLRCFSWEDAPFVKSVLLEVQNQYQAYLPNYIEALTRYIDRRDLTPFGTLRILEHNGECIGWLGEKIESAESVYLAHYYILQNRQGQGLGSQICTYYMQTLKNLGMKELVVDVHRSMPHVHHFYEQLGFKPCSFNEKREDALQQHFSQMKMEF